MTGRGAGNCARPGGAGLSGAGRGRGMGGWRGMWGRGSGGGRGWRNRFRATGLPGWARFGSSGTSRDGSDLAAEKRMLEREADALRAELESITKRLSEMGGGAESKQ